MALLEYENQMFLEVFQEDGMVVLAKGLGVERLLLHLIKTYSDPGNLVLIIGTSSQEEEYLNEKLVEAAITPLPKIITAEFSTKERYEVYMEGGVLFVTTRILVVDMLVERLPIDLITGIIVYRAHKILESCQEAFIIRLYRMKNKKGFIKALSSNPCAFTRGFFQVQRVMRNLFVRKLYLWPRFHAVVASSLEKVKPQVFEIHVPMTHAMQSIQIAVLDLMSVSVKELKKINPSLDTDELTVENAIAKSFDKIIKFQLDPIWHQLNSKTRRLISDLKTLKSVLKYLTQYDCVTFYSLLKSIKENVNLDTQISDWLFLDASESLFMHAKERLFGSSEKSKKTKSSHNKAENLEFEANPKWKALSEILLEVSAETKHLEKEVVVIVAEDETVCNQLQEVLSSGSYFYLSKVYKRLIKSEGVVTKASKEPSKVQTNEHSKGPRKIRKRKLKETECTLTQMLVKHGDSNSSEDENVVDTDSDENIIGKCSNLIIEFYPLRCSSSQFRLQRIFDLHHPSCIILYDGDMEVIRQIEVHQALNSSQILKVYFLVYSGSAEEQSYLTVLRREKEAFEFLIKEKATMVLPEGLDGKSDDHPDLERGTSTANETVNSRKAGGQDKPKVSQKIIVDMREFRSELPSLIHRRGIDVIPVTLEVGDYILTPETCVERKSVNDLIGSLNSGRLYTQAQSMCRLYKRPILLIEFDQNKAFSLQGKYYSGSDISHNVTSKLILLTQHFPTLRILWCPSPYATAEMFELLKVKKDQPDVQHVITLKSEGGDFADKYNIVAQDFISKLPGINLKNMWPIANNLNCIADIINYSEEQLSEILGNSISAKTLWASIHQEVKLEAHGLVSAKKGGKQIRSFKKRQ